MSESRRRSRSRSRERDLNAAPHLAEPIWSVGDLLLAHIGNSNWIQGRVAEIIPGERVRSVRIVAITDTIPDMIRAEKSAHLHRPLVPGTFRTLDPRSVRRDNVQKGDVMDCMDPEGIWYAGTVIDTRENGDVLIHYSRWRPMYDEWIPFESHRLQPYGTHVRATPAVLDTYERLKFCADNADTQAVLELGADCPVCMGDVSCEPVQLGCCLKWACRSCVKKFQKHKQQPTCPVCRMQTNRKFQVDVDLARRIALAHVHCPRPRCEWTGPLGPQDSNLYQHLTHCKPA